MSEARVLVLAPAPELLSPRSERSARITLASIEAQLLSEEAAAPRSAPATSYLRGGGYEQAAYAKLEILAGLLGDAPYADDSVAPELALFWLAAQLLRGVHLRTPVVPDESYARLVTACERRVARAAKEAALLGAETPSSLAPLKSLVRTVGKLLGERATEESAAKLERLRAQAETLVTLATQACARRIALPVRERDGTPSQLPALVARYAAEARALEAGTPQQQQQQPQPPQPPRTAPVAPGAAASYLAGTGELQRLYDFYSAQPRARAAGTRAHVENSLFWLARELLEGAARAPPEPPDGARVRAQRDALLAVWREPYWSLQALEEAARLADLYRSARALCAELDRVAVGAPRPEHVRARLALARCTERVRELAELAVTAVLRSFYPHGAPTSPRRHAELGAGAGAGVTPPSSAGASPRGAPTGTEPPQPPSPRRRSISLLARLFPK